MPVGFTSLICFQCGAYTMFNLISTFGYQSNLEHFIITFHVCIATSPKRVYRRPRNVKNLKFPTFSPHTSNAIPHATHVWWRARGERESPTSRCCCEFHSFFPFFFFWSKIVIQIFLVFHCEEPFVEFLLDIWFCEFCTDRRTNDALHRTTHIYKWFIGFPLCRVPDLKVRRPPASRCMFE